MVPETRVQLTRKKRAWFLKLQNGTLMNALRRVAIYKTSARCEGIIDVAKEKRVQPNSDRGLNAAVLVT